MKLDIKNITLKAKIFAMVVIFVTSSVLTLGYTIISMNSIGSELVSIAERDIPLTAKITKVSMHQLEQAVLFERAIRYGEEMQSEEAMQKKFNTSRDHFNELNQQINNELTSLEAFAATGVAETSYDKERKEFTHVIEVIRQVSQERNNYVTYAEQAFTHLQDHNVSKALASVEQAETLEKEMTHELNTLLDEIEKFTAESALNAEQHELHAVKIVIMIAIVSAVLAGIMFLIVLSGVGRLVSGMKRSITITNNIAEGNLTEVIEADGNDEIGTLLTGLKNMRDSVHSMVQQMIHSSNELTRASEELATVSEDTSRGIHTQQSEIQQAATAMNEMTATVQEVARHAQETSQSTNEADEESKHGQVVIDKTVASIESLEKVVNSAATVIEQVGQESNKIGSVLDVIKGIAEQTNLLALNAAIEAARAGEQGRGFAVVADEVRTLAQRTQDSTSEIDEMITGLQQSSKNAITAMESGREQASQSVERAAEAGESIRSITKVIGNINDMNTQIASAAEEQSSVAEEVNRNVITINEVAEQNATAVNQITVSSDELSRMAVSLHEMIARFKV